MHLSSDICDNDVHVLYDSMISHVSHNSSSSVSSSTALCLIDTQRTDISPLVVETLAGFLDSCIFLDMNLHKR